MATTPEAFTLAMIGELQGTNPKFPVGIHAVYSGFNAAFKRAFPGLDPVAFTTDLAKSGKIEVRLVRGGACLYRPGEAPIRKPSAADVAAARIMAGGVS